MIERFSGRRWTQRFEMLLGVGLPVLALMAYLISVVARWLRP